MPMMTSHVRRRAFAPLLLLCVAACAAFAPRARGQQAYKIDEADRARCDLSEVPQVTDPPMPIFVELEKHPAARAAIVVYGMPGEAMVYARHVKGWLTEARGVVAERLLDVYGGPAERLRLELWLVPPGAAPPPAAPLTSGERVTLFDRYGYWPGEYCGPDRPPALKNFAEVLRNMPGWRGTIVVRPHVNRRGAKAGDEDWDESPLSRRGALRHAAEDRLHLIGQLGLHPSRIRAVVGARADWAHSELWLIPPAARKAGGGAGAR